MVKFPLVLINTNFVSLIPTYGEVSFKQLHVIEFVSDLLLVFSLYSSFLHHYNQCRLNAWARWAVARGRHEHMGPMLIYVC